MSMEAQSEKKGWSWLGFLFAPFYYAGYGKFGKGLLLLLIGAVPILGVAAYVYGGLKAKKELPIGEQKFSWLNAVGLFGLLVGATGALSALSIRFLTIEQTPDCKSEIVIDKLYGEMREQTAKNMKEIGFSLDDAGWKATGFRISDIGIISYDEVTDSYQCKANTSVKENRSMLIPIEYTVSSEDGEVIVSVKDIDANPLSEEPDFFAETTQEVYDDSLGIEPYDATGTHCHGGEDVIFSCDTGGKVVSVCASKDLSNPSIQYRFGKLGSPEIIVPDRADDFHGKVLAYHLNVGGSAEARGIEFANDGFTYGINGIQGYIYVAKDGNGIAEFTCVDMPKDNINPEYLKKMDIEIEED